MHAYAYLCLFVGSCSRQALHAAVVRAAHTLSASAASERKPAPAPSPGPRVPQKVCSRHRDTVVVHDVHVPGRHHLRDVQGAVIWTFFTF